MYSLTLANLPLVLCGPILRKVTESEVSVFIATKEPCRVRLEVRALLPAGGPPAATADLPLLQFGSNLYAGVVTLKNLNLQVTTIYGYDLTLTPSSGAAKNLAALGLLGGKLNYAGLALPSFVLPQPSNLYVCHGSCRKIHGPGKDALAVMDDLIATHGSNRAARPQQLLLTGDQIYADDVAPAVLRMVSDLAKLLVGAADMPPNIVDFVHSDGRPKARVALLDHFGKHDALGGGLSSDEGAFHLARLGEFYAMYLLAWNDDVWPLKVATFDSFYPVDSDFDLQSLTPSGSNGALDKLVTSVGELARTLLGDPGYASDPKKDPGTNRLHIRSFLETLPKVRRALANIPTYMMFDDHEITDDWFLDGAWRADALSNPASAQVIRNGLLAYCVFQKWGNTPDDLDLGSAARPFAPLDVANTLGTGASMSATTGLTALGLSAATSANAPDFSLRLEFGTHRLIFVDTRTRRQGNADWNDQSEWELKLFRSVADVHLEAPSQSTPAGASDPLTLVVFPPPLLGVPKIEETQQSAVEKSRALARTADAEFAGGNVKLFRETLAALAAFGRVVVISGDVHYGFTRVLRYFARAANAAWDSSSTTATIVQVCSSAFKNTPAWGLRDKKGYLWLASRVDRALGRHGLVQPHFGSIRRYGLLPSTPLAEGTTPKGSFLDEHERADRKQFMQQNASATGWRGHAGVPHHWLEEEHLKPPTGGKQWDDYVDWCFEIGHVDSGTHSIAPLALDNNLGQLHFNPNYPTPVLGNHFHCMSDPTRVLSQDVGDFRAPNVSARPSLLLRKP